ncbi:hypothetical protein [Nocardia neocaledoniensis]|uniref:hypothetical protein n=1 Tax=Nocardia neocaledoniensis TaxID=236511 RepID=UPI002454DAC4|nr:hypothetical protein [Nocardia neocaledoniensis]
MMRTRYVDIYVPIGPGAGSGNPVAAMAALFGAVIALALLVMVAVVLAFPSHRYPTEPVQVSTVPVTHTVPVCAAFCQDGGAQR